MLLNWSGGHFTRSIISLCYYLICGVCVCVFTFARHTTGPVVFNLCLNTWALLACTNKKCEFCTFLMCFCSIPSRSIFIVPPPPFSSIQSGYCLPPDQLQCIFTKLYTTYPLKYVSQIPGYTSNQKSRRKNCVTSVWKLTECKNILNSSWLRRDLYLTHLSKDKSFKKLEKNYMQCSVIAHGYCKLVSSVLLKYEYGTIYGVKVADSVVIV